jgi:hypothetical protein
MKNSSNLFVLGFLKFFPGPRKGPSTSATWALQRGHGCFPGLKLYLQFEFKYESKYKLEPLTLKISKIYAVVSVSKESLYGYSMDSMMDYMDIV